MRKGEEQLDELFRRRLENYSVEPPEEVWSGIQSGLNSGRPLRRLIYWRWIAAAAVLLLALVSSVMFLIKPDNAFPDFAQKTQNPGLLPGPGNDTAETEQTASLPAKETSVVSFLAEDRNAVENLQKSRSPENIKMTLVPIESDREKISLLTSIRTFLTHDSYREELRPAIKRVTIPADLLNETDRMIVAGNLQHQPITDAHADKAWKVGVHLSPGLSSHTASHSQVYARNMTYSDEEPRTNLGGGVSVQYRTASRWRIESGMYYARSGGNSGNSMSFLNNRTDFMDYSGSAEKYFNTGVTLQKGQMMMNSTAGVIDFSRTPTNAELISMPEASLGLSAAMLSPGEFSQVFDFVEIPLFARYKLIDSGIDVELMGGISTSFVVGNNVYMENNGVRELVGTTRDINTMNLSGTAGVGVTYVLARNLSLSFEPRINYYLNSINHSGEVNFRPWRAGLFTGISYEF